VEYHVQDALHDRERQHKRRLLDYYEDAYLKDLITEDELAARVREILLDPEARDLFMKRAYIRKYRKPKEA